MINHIVRRSAVAGCVRGVLLFIVLDYSLSTFAEPAPITASFLCCTLFCLLHCVLSAVQMSHISQRKTLVVYYFMELGWFFAGCLLALLNLLTIHIRLFPLRAAGNGDGLLLLFLAAGFLIVTEVSRLLFLIIFLIKRRNRYHSGE